MEAALRNEVNWSGIRQNHHRIKGGTSQSGNCHAMDWNEVLLDNPDFFGEQSGGSNFLDIPTYMRRGITLSSFSVES